MALLIAGLVGGIIYGAIIALVTSGMTLIYRISGIVNFAHGSLMAVAMYIAFAMARTTGVDPLLTTVITTPLMALVGLVVYWGGIHPIRSRHHLLAVQLLLGLSFVIEALLLIAFGGDIQTAPDALSGHYLSVLGTGISVIRMASAVLAIIALSTLAAVLAKTDWGRRLRAAASDEFAATLCGVSRVRLEAWAWAVGVGSLGLIGPALAAIFPMTPDMGLSYTVLALVVLICGGGGALGGTVVAGVLVGVVQNLGLLYLPKSYGGLLPYMLLVLVLVFQPGGLTAMRPALVRRTT